MDSPNASTVEAKLQHYQRNCKQHLSRVRLSHLIALSAVHDDETWAKTHGDVAAKSFESHPADLRQAKLRRGLNEVHLIALKANFELYLNRVATSLWTVEFDRLAAKVDKEVRVSSRYIADLLSSNPGTVAVAKEMIISRIVPGYGLFPLFSTIERATGVNLRDLLETRLADHWSQIVVAFEVRHLVEHCDGKPDIRFRENVRDYRGRSTWGRRQDLNAAEKVHVEEEDVAITYEAMLGVTEVMSERLLARRQ